MLSKFIIIRITVNLGQVFTYRNVYTISNKLFKCGHTGLTRKLNFYLIVSLVHGK